MSDKHISPAFHSKLNAIGQLCKILGQDRHRLRTVTVQRPADQRAIEARMKRIKQHVLYELEDMGIQDLRMIPSSLDRLLTLDERDRCWILDDLTSTVDPDICRFLPQGSNALPFTVKDSDHSKRLEQDPDRWIFQVDRGLRCKPTCTSDIAFDPLLDSLDKRAMSQQTEDLLAAFQTYYLRSSERITYPLMWCANTKPPKSPATVRSMADLVRKLVARNPDLAQEDLRTLADKSYPGFPGKSYAAIALRLAGVSLSAVIGSDKLVPGIATEHDRLALLQKFGSLEQFLMEYSSYTLPSPYDAGL